MSPIISGGTSSGALPSPIPGPVTIAAAAGEAALTVTNSGPIADLFNAQGDDANYLMDAEGQFSIHSDLGAHYTGIATGGTEAGFEMQGASGASFGGSQSVGWRDSGNVTRFVAGTDGLFIQFGTDPGTLAGYDPGTLFIWFDSTAGAAKLRFKALNASGVLVAGEVALT